MRVLLGEPRYCSSAALGLDYTTSTVLRVDAGPKEAQRPPDVPVAAFSEYGRSGVEARVACAAGRGGTVYRPVARPVADGVWHDAGLVL